jgi:LacI family transcriptional regulator
MHDVAALAGVSQKTVSRVVNGEQNVSLPVQERVQRAVDQLGYRHNLAASALRSGQPTRSIALLVQDLSNDYSAAVLRALDDAARVRGVVVLSASLDEEEARERELVADLINRRVDGLVMMPTSESQAYLQPDVRAGFAVVTIDRPARHVAADSVLVDNNGGAYDATKHLLAHGHRRIALLVDEPRIATAVARRAGFERALLEAGVTPEPALVLTARTVADARAALASLLALTDPPTAVFAARNTITIGAALELRAQSLHRSVALVGFDEIRTAELADPGITSVEQNPVGIGREAARLLLARLDGWAGPPEELVLPTTLVARGSGEIVVAGL